MRRVLEPAAALLMALLGIYLGGVVHLFGNIIMP